jgi:predicted Fe-Mo cluster-binding NifX family protein
MIIAIPLFNTRVAPRFDCARKFLLAEIDGPQSWRPRWVTIDSGPVRKRIQQISDLNISTVICGGIDTESARLLQFSNITIIAWVAGEAEDAVNCLLQGELESGAMVGHGGRRCGRWAFGRRALGFGGGFPERDGDGTGQWRPGPPGRQGRRSGNRGQGR